jgi:hypothetical protein
MLFFLALAKLATIENFGNTLLYGSGHIIAENVRFFSYAQLTARLKHRTSAVTCSAGVFFKCSVAIVKISFLG